MSASHQAGAGPELVRVQCKSWKRFESLFRRNPRPVFLVARRPPPRGAKLSLHLSAPDGSWVVVPAVVSATLPVTAPGERPGMLVEIGELSERDAARVDALLRVAHAYRRPSQRPPTEDEAAAVRERLRTEHFALSHADDPAVLGIEPQASADSIQQAYLELFSRYHPDAYRHYNCAEVRSLASEILAIVERAYRRLSGTGDAFARAGHGDRALVEAARLIDESRFDDAQQKLTEVLSRDATSAPAKVLLLLSHARRAKRDGDLQQAFECYRALLELDGEHAEAVLEIRRLSCGTTPASMLRTGRS